MLILTRRVNEIITIGNNTTITVVRAEGNQVGLAIRAPTTIPVLREEIHNKNQTRDQPQIHPLLQGPVIGPDTADCPSTGALVLSRRIGETLMIGDDVMVKVLGVHGRQVRIGIRAPSRVKVHRLEIYLSNLQDNKT